LEQLLQRKELSQEPCRGEDKLSLNQALRWYVAEHKDQLNLVEEDEDSPVEDARTPADLEEDSKNTSFLLNPNASINTSTERQSPVSIKKLIPLHRSHL